MPSFTRVKLDNESEHLPSSDELMDTEEDNCSICLQPFKDRTVIPTCSHEFCFECLLVWAEQSRRCPLCSANIGDHLIHKIRSNDDYQKRFLPPLSTDSPKPLPPMSVTGVRRPARTITRARERRWGRQESEEADRLERSIRKRKWIYAHHLYAKHIASNSQTRFRPCPTPAQFTASQDLQSRVTTFLRRELRVWINLDIEFLTTFIISMMKAIDIRSESAVKLLSEFLDMDTPYVEGKRHPNAEHFAHEVYTFLRSPYKDLFVYDSIVQYDEPEANRAPSPPRQSTSRWSPSLAHSYTRSRSHRSSPSVASASDVSWSPSGRYYPSAGRTHSPSPPPRKRRRESRPLNSQNHKGKGKERATSTLDEPSDEDLVAKRPSPTFESPCSRGGSRDCVPQQESPHEVEVPLSSNQRGQVQRDRERKPLRAPRQVSIRDSIRGYLAGPSTTLPSTEPQPLASQDLPEPRGAGDSPDVRQGGTLALSQRVASSVENGISIRGAASHASAKTHAAETEYNGAHDDETLPAGAPHLNRPLGEPLSDDRPWTISRESLLKKLVNEKRVAAIASAGPAEHDRYSSSSANENSDMEAMEAKLRMKARVKQRLANVKQKLAEAT